MAGPLGKKSSIGRLRNRCRIESADTARSRFGDEQLTWATSVTRVFCEVKAASGRELFASGQVQAEVSHRVTMRHRTDLTETMRLVWLDGANAVLNVVAVLPSVGESNMLEVWCLQEK